MATKKPALAYLRTSSAANVGEDKDSDKRQLAAIEGYARRNGYEVIRPPFYDASVSGADPIEGRSGFSAMLAYLAEHPECHTILVEDASRFVRGILLQESSYIMLKSMGIELIPVAAPDHFTNPTGDPMIDAMRQMIGVMNELQRKIIVRNLRAARDRKRAKGVKVEGRKSHAELHPDVVELARKLHRKPRGGERASLRAISFALAEQGHVSTSGKPYGPSAVRSMLMT